MFKAINSKQYGFNQKSKTVQQQQWQNNNNRNNNINNLQNSNNFRQENSGFISQNQNSGNFQQVQGKSDKNSFKSLGFEQEILGIQDGEEGQILGVLKKIESKIWRKEKLNMSESDTIVNLMDLALKFCEKSGKNGEWGQNQGGKAVLRQILEIQKMSQGKMAGKKAEQIFVSRMNFLWGRVLNRENFEAILEFLPGFLEDKRFQGRVFEVVQEKIWEVIQGRKQEKNWDQNQNLEKKQEKQEKNWDNSGQEKKQEKNWVSRNQSDKNQNNKSKKEQIQVIRLGFYYFSLGKFMNLGNSFNFNSNQSRSSGLQSRNEEKFLGVCREFYKILQDIKHEIRREKESEKTNLMKLTVQQKIIQWEELIKLQKGIFTGISIVNNINSKEQDVFCEKEQRRFLSKIGVFEEGEKRGLIQEDFEVLESYLVMNDFQIDFTFQYLVGFLDFYGNQFVFKGKLLLFIQNNFEFMGVEQLIKYYLSFSTKNFWFEEKYFEKFMNRYYKCLLENKKQCRQDLQQNQQINQQFVVLQEKSNAENNQSVNQHQQQQEKKQVKKLGQWEIYNGFWILSRNLGDFPIQEKVLQENLDQILEMVRNDLENQNYYDIIGALQGLVNWEIYQEVQEKRNKNLFLQQKQIQDKQIDFDYEQKIIQNQNQKSNIQDQNQSQVKNKKFFKIYQELCQSIEKKIGNRQVKNSQILSILQQAINYLQLSFQEEGQEFFSQKFIESLYQNSNENQQRASGRNELYQQQQLKQEEKISINNNNNNNNIYKNQGQKSQTEQQIGEIVIKFFEKKYGLNFQKNVIIGKYECDLGDFNNKRILIEINGERHFNLSFLKNWEKNYSQKQWQEFRQAPYNSNFQMKLKILEMMGYKVLNLDFMEYMMVSQDQVQLENFVHKKIVNFMENL